MDQLWEKIIGLDLKSVTAKYSEKKSWWWHMWRSPARIESEYRQFLYLLASNPGKVLVPWSQDVDDFWREHILDPRKYAPDCNLIAGGLLQYRPHLSHGSVSHDRECEETRKLYLAAFGESARRRRQAEGKTWPQDEGAPVFSDGGGYAGSGHHGHHSASHGWGHGGGGGHHGGAGVHASGGHGGGGHGGHGCGGHSSCGGHGGGCGGHGGH
jgi:hypothetical protein